MGVGKVGGLGMSPVLRDKHVRRWERREGVGWHWESPQHDKIGVDGDKQCCIILLRPINPPLVKLGPSFLG